MRLLAALLLATVGGMCGATALLIGQRVLPRGEFEHGLVVRPTSDVIVAVRDLARLETAAHHVERIIDLRDRQSRFWGLLRTQDAILLVAAGDITAGVDLAALGEDDIRVDPATRSVVILLPPPEVLSTRIDSERTFVHRRDTDFFAQRRESLESEARREAERTLRDASIRGGILDRAGANALRTVESLVRSLGYENVEVRFREATPTLEAR